LAQTGPNFCRSPFTRRQTWVDFFLEGVEQTANGAVQTARRLVDLFDADMQRTQNVGRTAPNALRVLAALRQRPVLGIPQLCQRTGMTFPTASKAMDKLAGSGIVRELTRQRRNRVFVYGAYQDILSEGEEPL
jgi:Fic family protein